MRRVILMEILLIILLPCAMVLLPLRSVGVQIRVIMRALVGVLNGQIRLGLGWCGLDWLALCRCALKWLDSAFGEAFRLTGG